MVKENTNEEHRKAYYFLYLRKLVYFLLLHIGVFFSAQDSTKDSIFIDGGTIVIGDTEITNFEKYTTKVYLTKETIIIDFSGTKNYELTYIEKEEDHYKPLVNKNIHKKNQIVKTGKVPHTDKNANNTFCLKETSNELFFTRQISGLDIGILVSSTKNKIEQLIDVLFNILSLPSERLNIIVIFNKIKRKLFSEIFFTRPPPFSTIL